MIVVEIFWWQKSFVNFAGKSLLKSERDEGGRWAGPGYDNHRLFMLIAGCDAQCDTGTGRPHPSSRDFRIVNTL